MFVLCGANIYIMIVESKQSKEKNVFLLYLVRKYIEKKVSKSMPVFSGGKKICPYSLSHFKFTIANADAHPVKSYGTGIAD